MFWKDALEEIRDKSNTPPFSRILKFKGQIR